MTDETEDTSLYLPGLAGLYQQLAPFGYPLMRFAAGAILIVHGYGKLFGGFAPIIAQRVLTPMGFPLPTFWAYFLGVLETLGAACLAVGFLTRPMAAMLAFEFIFVTDWHSKNGYGFSAQGGGYEYPLLLLAIYVGILLQGSGRYSVDRAIGREF